MKRTLGRIKKIISFDELEHEWCKSNPHIHHGYRTNLTAKEAFLSLFHAHNELVNIWTHLLSAIGFLYLAWIDESVPIALYCVNATFLFLCSSAFHCFQALGIGYAQKLVKLDYLGILVQICGSFVTAFHYSFYCLEDVRFLYQVGIVTFCVLGLYVSLSETFSRPDYQIVRVVLFALIISYALLPMAHMIYLHGLYHHEMTDLAAGFLWMILTYAIGATIYAKQWPETWYPGKFDLVGSSHQLWHCCVTLAAFIHYQTLHEYLDYREEFGCEGW